MINKLLIANRGEIALRVIRACHELGIEAVAVYSDADQDSLHVSRADEAVNIGPPPAGRSYLNAAAIVRAALDTGAEAVHPGYGFLAENASFAASCEDAGLVFVGPSSQTISEMGDKSAARSLAKRAGVPVVPGSENVTSLEEALATASEVGYPVMVKAASGGGGRGIRVARGEKELRGLFGQARQEAQAAFGDGSVYMEKLIERPRHVEVQVFGDGSGTVFHLYERECSMQRRRQKVLEEAPSPGISAGLREEICAAAVRLAEAVSYSGAGTMEFLVEKDAFYFIEMNTRIQVEHPITEMVTGVDLVKEQILLASGEPPSFSQEEIKARGWAIEFRINAEDPDNGFAPSPGEVSSLELPGGPGVRVDSALYPGYRVPPFYDSLVGKLSVWGRDRAEALDRGRRALAEYRIGGLRTTIPLHTRLLEEAPFISGSYHTGFLEKLLGS